MRFSTGSLLTSSFGSEQCGGERDFTDLGLYGCEGAARARVAVFRWGVRILRANRAMGGADSGAAGDWIGAVAGSARRGAPGAGAGGVAARDAGGDGGRHA